MNYERIFDRDGDHIARPLLRLAFICGVRFRTSEDVMFGAALNTFTSIAARSVHVEYHFLERVFESVYESNMRRTLKAINEPIDSDKMALFPGGHYNSSGQLN
jgi:hypothetical protein